MTVKRQKIMLTKSSLQVAVILHLNEFQLARILIISSRGIESNGFPSSFTTSWCLGLSTAVLPYSVLKTAAVLCMHMQFYSLEVILLDSYPLNRNYKNNLLTSDKTKPLLGKA